MNFYFVCTTNNKCDDSICQSGKIHFVGRSRNRQPLANLLIFEKSNLQYILSVDKGIESTLTARELGKIADSIIDSADVK